MRSDDEIRAGMAPVGAGAAFRAERAGGLALITPLTSKAREWLQSNVDSEATWRGDALVIEMRYFPPLVDGILDAGFLFERDAYQN